MRSSEGITFCHFKRFIESFWNGKNVSSSLRKLMFPFPFLVEHFYLNTVLLKFSYIDSCFSGMVSAYFLIDGKSFKCSRGPVIFNLLAAQWSLSCVQNRKIHKNRYNIKSSQQPRPQQCY